MRILRAVLFALLLMTGRVCRAATCKTGATTDCIALSSNLVAGATIAGTAGTYVFNGLPFNGAPSGVASSGVVSYGCGLAICTLVEYYPVGVSTSSPVIIDLAGCGWGNLGNCTIQWGTTQTEAPIEQVQFGNNIGLPVIFIQYPLTSGGNQWPVQIQAVQCAKRYLEANLGTSNLPGNRADMRWWGESSGDHLLIMGNLVPDAALGIGGCTTGAQTNQPPTRIVSTSLPSYLATNNPVGTNMYQSASGADAPINALLGSSNYATATAADTSGQASPGMWTSSWSTTMKGTQVRFEVGGNSIGNIGYNSSQCSLASNCDQLVLTTVNENPLLNVLNLGFLLWDGPSKHVSNHAAGFGDQAGNACSQTSNTPCEAVNAMNFLQAVATANSGSSGGSSASGYNGVF